MGLHFRQAICRYIILLAWITNFISAQMITQDSSSGLSSGSSYFFYQRPEFPRDCEEVRQQCSFQNRSGVFLIKPDGFPTPFEVFCDNPYMSDDGGWMVILRRSDGSVQYNRTWDEYKHGFGFLGTEFWLGNDKLAYVTNQKQFELRIDMVKADGSSLYITYDNLRISDEWGGYSLTSLGEYGGSADAFITSCERNMEFGACICQGTCDQPEATNNCDTNCVHGEGCVCPDGFLFKGNDCVPENECGCFVEERGVIPNGDTYINNDCSSRCTCNNDVLTCENYLCSPNANCEERNNIRMCYCNDGFEGNGQRCTSTVREDCLDLYNAGNRNNAVYTIHPSGWSSGGIQVYCDMTTAGGGWTVFQRRRDGGESFYRPWSTYKRGFGTLTDEFWLGNDKLHVITNQKNYELRIDLRNSAGSSYYALYDLFRVNNEGDNYRLAGLGSYSGNAGYDSMNSRRNQPFSTYDNDNEASRYSCAEKHRGGWWYGGYHDGSACDTRSLCRSWRHGRAYCYCAVSNLNGDYNRNGSESIFWGSLPGNACGIKFTEMKIRPL